MEDMAAIMVVIMEVVGVIGRYWLSRWSTATSRIWSKIQTLLKIIDLERKDSLCYCQKELELIWDYRCKASCRKARQNSLKKGPTHTYPAWLYGIKNPARLWILESNIIAAFPAVDRFLTTYVFFHYTESLQDIIFVWHKSE